MAKENKVATRKEALDRLNREYSIRVWQRCGFDVDIVADVYGNMRVKQQGDRPIDRLEYDTFLVMKGNEVILDGGLREFNEWAEAKIDEFMAQSAAE